MVCTVICTLENNLHLYENFLHKNFYTRSNYSNRAVIHINHTNFYNGNLYHEKFCMKKMVSYSILEAVG